MHIQRCKMVYLAVFYRVYIVFGWGFPTGAIGASASWTISFHQLFLLDRCKPVSLASDPLKEHTMLLWPLLHGFRFYMFTWNTAQTLDSPPPHSHQNQLFLWLFLFCSWYFMSPWFPLQGPHLNLLCSLHHSLPKFKLSSTPISLPSYPPQFLSFHFNTATSIKCSGPMPQLLHWSHTWRL